MRLMEAKSPPLQDQGRETIKFGDKYNGSKYTDAFKGKKWMKWLLARTGNISAEQQKFLKWVSWKMSQEEDEAAKNGTARSSGNAQKKAEQKSKRDIKQEIKETDTASWHKLNEAEESEGYDDDHIEEMTAGTNETERVNNLENIVHEVITHTQSNTDRMIRVETVLEKIMLQMANIEMSVRK